MIITNRLFNFQSVTIYQSVKIILIIGSEVSDEWMGVVPKRLKLLFDMYKI
jgi:hypothetical protein